MSETPHWDRDTGFGDSPAIQFHGGRQFDIDWAYGRPAEKLVAEICGLADSGRVHIEVKRKRRDDGKFYIELEHDPGRRGEFTDSGLRTTKAEFWAFAIAETGIVLIVRPEILETAIERNYGFPAQERDGSCPTRGRLLDVFDILAATRPGPASRAQFGDEFRWPA